MFRLLQYTNHFVLSVFFICTIGSCNFVDVDAASPYRSLRSTTTSNRSSSVLVVTSSNDPSREHRRQLTKLEVVVGQMGTPIEKLAKCQGDCDWSSECQDGLICMQRDGNEPVPGCRGLTSSKSGIDFCIDPNDMMNPPKKQVDGAVADDRQTPVPTRAPTKRNRAKTSTTTTTTTTVSGHCRQEQLDFSTCLSGKAVCRQCFAPILGQQLACDSLEVSVCNVLNTDACECDRCAGVFKRYYDCVSDNICSALQCDGTAGSILQTPTTPAPTVLDNNNSNMVPPTPTSSPLPVHTYKGSTVLNYVGNNGELDGILLGRCEGDWYVLS
jgi:hypothetical protein